MKIFNVCIRLTGQSSYSHHSDSDVGVAVIDRFTYYTLETLEKVKRQDKTTMQNMVWISTLLTLRLYLYTLLMNHINNFEIKQLV